MSIKLDWEVESAGGWEEIGEDPSAIAQREKRSRNLRNTILILLGVAAVASGAIFFRLNQVGKQFESNLIALVGAETTALRTGNRSEFLKAQSHLDPWRRHQDQTFARYQELGSHLDVTGEIITMEIKADQAQVTLLEYLDEDPYHVIWFYQYTPDTGWLHIPASAQFWGEPHTITGPYFSISYYQGDEQTAQLLSQWINSWWQSACELTACSTQPESFTIQIEPDPLAELEWAAYDTSILIIPSPKLERFSPNDPLSPETIEQTASVLATYWIVSQFNQEKSFVDNMTWADRELILWLKNEFIASPERTLFSDLIDNHGVTVFQQFFRSYHQGNDIVPLLTNLTQLPANELQVDWSGYIADRLKGEANLLEKGYLVEAALLYRDPDRADVDTQFNALDGRLASPSTIYVEETHYSYGGINPDDAILWADVSFAITTGLGSYREIITQRTYEAFRLVDNRWTHTTVQPAYWGENRQFREGSTTINYRELDEPAIEGLLPFTHSVIEQIAADYGINRDALTFTITITPEADTQPAPTSGQVQVVILSPHRAIRAGDQSAQDYLQSEITAKLVQEMALVKLRDFSATHPFTIAFMRWEFERRGLDADQAVNAYLNVAGRSGHYWPTTQGLFTFSSPYTESQYLPAYVLLLTMIDRYGPEIIPVMMDTLPLASDIDHWLTLSAGIRVADIENEWRALYVQALEKR